jgi:hypothetical protein
MFAANQESSDLNASNSYQDIDKAVQTVELGGRRHTGV